MAGHDEAQRQAATGTAGNASSDTGPARTGSPDSDEATGAVRVFADSGGSGLSESDVAALDEATPGAPVGAAGRGTIGGAVGGAGTAGTYTGTGTAAGTGGGTTDPVSAAASGPTGLVSAQGSTGDAIETMREDGIEHSATDPEG